MRTKPRWSKKVVIPVVLVFAAACILLFGGPGIAEQGAKAQQKAYAVYTQKCLGCHASVADPERPGRTRDDWHLVVHVMHDYGTDMSDQESAMIVDLLYSLRKGMEREAG